MGYGFSASDIHESGSYSRGVTLTNCDLRSRCTIMSIELLTRSNLPQPWMRSPVDDRRILRHRYRQRPYPLFVGAVREPPGVCRGVDGIWFVRSGFRRIETVANRVLGKDSLTGRCPGCTEDSDRRIVQHRTATRTCFHAEPVHLAGRPTRAHLAITSPLRGSRRSRAGPLSLVLRLWSLSLSKGRRVVEGAALSLSKGQATADAVGDVNASPCASSMNKHIPILRSSHTVRI